VKNKIIYIFLFLIAFLFTTGAVVFLNSIYKNIFRNDFRLATVSDTAGVKDSTKTLNASLNGGISDSLRALNPGKYQDSLHASNSKDSTSTDSLKQSANLAAQEVEQLPGGNTKTKPDSSYIVWMKQTAKMYESMDPKKAAKIIQSYSDNIARDIIYSMRQKKAAEILSELNPDTANRITRAKSNAF
jgi:flagellar motility protein MotE (MotC chaperone)